MEDLPLGRIAALVSEFAVNDLPLGRRLIMMMIYMDNLITEYTPNSSKISVFIALLASEAPSGIFKSFNSKYGKKYLSKLS